jgi:hypothetical protein
MTLASSDGVVIIASADNDSRQPSCGMTRTGVDQYAGLRSVTKTPAGRH